jgi:flagellar FliL protein
VKKKLMIAVPVLLLLVGAAYKLVLAPKGAEAKPKIAGTIVQLDPEFIVNLSDGRFAKVSVAVVAASGVPPAPEGATPLLTQNAAVRAVVTDVLTDASGDSLIRPAGRHGLAARIVKELRRTTDEHITRIYFTDVAIQ